MTSDQGPVMSDPPDFGWIQTFTGKRFWPLAPRAEDVDIRDIAHALSMKCRFSGHTKQFYSVAQHSVLVAHRVAEKSPQFALDALLHDAAEAYLPDIASPIKYRFNLASEDMGDCCADSFSDVEQRVLDAIAKGLGVDVFLAGEDPIVPEAVKHADLTLLATEARDLMVWPPAVSWGPLPEPLEKVIQPLDPGLAEMYFLGAFKRLTGKV